ncbi:hypothetical protein [Kitasatospora sp. NPDC093102]|uniref:hypothetical protein n=1 Tax=Kitasatospora sp. NPDC093102 TaxID=3155069 RepID=UPI003424533F
MEEAARRLGLPVDVVRAYARSESSVSVAGGPGGLAVRRFAGGVSVAGEVQFGSAQSALNRLPVVPGVSVLHVAGIRRDGTPVMQGVSVADPFGWLERLPADVAPDDFQVNWSTGDLRDGDRDYDHRGLHAWAAAVATARGRAVRIPPASHPYLRLTEHGVQAVNGAGEPGAMQVVHPGESPLDITSVPTSRQPIGALRLPERTPRHFSGQRGFSASSLPDSANGPVPVLEFPGGIAFVGGGTARAWQPNLERLTQHAGLFTIVVAFVDGEGHPWSTTGPLSVERMVEEARNRGLGDNRDVRVVFAAVLGDDDAGYDHLRWLNHVYRTSAALGTADRPVRVHVLGCLSPDLDVRPDPSAGRAGPLDLIAEGSVLHPGEWFPVAAHGGSGEPPRFVSRDGQLVPARSDGGAHLDQPGISHHVRLIPPAGHGTGTAGFETPPGPSLDGRLRLAEHPGLFTISFSRLNEHGLPRLSEDDTASRELWRVAGMAGRYGADPSHALRPLFLEESRTHYDEQVRYTLDLSTAMDGRDGYLPDEQTHMLTPSRGDLIAQTTARMEFSAERDRRGILVRDDQGQAVTRSEPVAHPAHWMRVRGYRTDLTQPPGHVSVSGRLYPAPALPQTARPYLRPADVPAGRTWSAEEAGLFHRLEGGYESLSGGPAGALPYELVPGESAGLGRNACLLDTLAQLVNTHADTNYRALDLHQQLMEWGYQDDLEGDSLDFYSDGGYALAEHLAQTHGVRFQAFSYDTVNGLAVHPLVGNAGPVLHLLNDRGHFAPLHPRQADPDPAPEPAATTPPATGTGNNLTDTLADLNLSLGPAGHENTSMSNALLNTFADHHRMPQPEPDTTQADPEQPEQPWQRPEAYTETPLELLNGALWEHASDTLRRPNTTQADREVLLQLQDYLLGRVLPIS